MMEKVVIDPVTRIEGHLRMEAEVEALPDDIEGYGEVTRASSAGTSVIVISRMASRISM